MCRQLVPTVEDDVMPVVAEGLHVQAFLRVRQPMVPEPQRLYAARLPSSVTTVGRYITQSYGAATPPTAATARMVREKFSLLAAAAVNA